MQRLADQTGLTVTVAHHPPGTSKWNRIEHRMFAFSSPNWRGKPLLTHKVIVQLIAATTTTSGLNIDAVIDVSQYPKGHKVPDLELAKLKIRYDAFHPEWNYSISPGHLQCLFPQNDSGALPAIRRRSINSQTIRTTADAGVHQKFDAFRCSLTTRAG